MNQRDKEELRELLFRRIDEALGPEPGSPKPTLDETLGAEDVQEAIQRMEADVAWLRERGFVVRIGYSRTSAVEVEPADSNPVLEQWRKENFKLREAHRRKVRALRDEVILALHSSGDIAEFADYFLARLEEIQESEE